MPNDTHMVVPQPIIDLSREAARFADGAQRISFNDDSDIGVAAAAAQFRTLMESIAEGMGLPSKDGDQVDVEDFAAHIAPLIEPLAHMVDVFRDDAASGTAALPDLNDLEVGLTLLDQDIEELYRFAKLVATVDISKVSAERGFLMECLSEVGVPVAAVGLQIPVRIKLLIVIVAILIFLQFPRLRARVIKLLLALLRLDRRGQGGDGKGGDGQGGDGQGGDGQGGDGQGGGGGGKVRCGTDVTIVATGTGATKAKALLDAFRNAKRQAVTTCPAKCPPVLRSGGTPVKYTGGKNGQPFTAETSFTFRCT